MEKIFNRKIIFSHVPLEGCFRYKDIFQIFPLENKDASNLQSCAYHYPIVIEYFFDTPDTEFMPVCKNSSIKSPIPVEVTNASVANKKLKEILALLSVFTNYRFFDYDAEQAWFVPKIEGFPKSCEWGQTMYIPPDFGNLKEFSSTEWLCEVKKKGLGYYSNPSMHFAGCESPIIFPDFIDDLFDKYSNLDSKAKKSFDSAVMLFCNGDDLFGRMGSLSFAAFVSSIETLIEHNRDKDRKIEKCRGCKTQGCNGCGQNKYESTKNFKDFICEYGRIPKENEELKKYIAEIYKTRSHILHKGSLLLWDYPHHSWYSEDDGEKFEEDMMHRYFRQVVRICFVNWIGTLNSVTK